MQFIVKTITGLAILSAPLAVQAQSTFLPQGSKHQPFLNRLEIKLQRNLDLNVSTIKPFSRRTAVEVAEYADSLQTATGNLLNKVDRANLQSLLLNNSEWVEGDRSAFASKKSLWNTFYKTKANFFEVDENDFFLAVNPVLQLQLSSESDDSDKTLFLNTRGVTLRGMIAKRLGFSAYVTENQERGPLFLQDRINQFNAVPGVGFYKKYKTTGVDYLDARGSINFTAAKYLDFQFGYDKLFIGNGYRSLFLSDYGNSYLFLKINTKIWKFNYMNLFMELTPQTIRINAGNKLLDKKYVAMHHLSLQATRWLNVGVFEAISFGRTNHFDFTYLNPIIFLRASEQQNGSADNAIVGFDAKANVAKKLQFYGQFALDELVIKEFTSSKGWWGNKFALQLGGKYIDAFGVPNLDIQGEMNFIRPFTYSHYDSVANYTHYNQPLAHPMGANVVEAIGIVRYQPHPKWTASARVIAWKQGTDTANANFGSDIFKGNETRSADYGYKLPSGPKTNGLNAQLLLSYEWKENLFLEGAALLRRLSSDLAPTNNNSVITVGVRWNMFRREYDY
ncbi:MAG: hypothetical protein P0Y53_08830 [Candidatus Pseudobacter hemicellulosilyticus]|uniref:Capsule assembly Wzi family protein n=1 Tax=Candidatus Pseudobacter hemicellulosilyticus TaxID=3121375 RepID=A0AAJ5X019_9BACT|nr:MAG: hypothetical protein P0Y53_08830 [Pseudobacter sp.]